MLSDESRPTARVLSDDVSPATREKRPVSRKKLKNLPLTSSHSKSGRPGECSNCVTDIMRSKRQLFWRKRPISPQKAKHIRWGSALSRVRDKDILIVPRRSLDSDERFVRINL